MAKNQDVLLNLEFLKKLQNWIENANNVEEMLMYQDNLKECVNYDLLRKKTLELDLLSTVLKKNRDCYKKNVECYTNMLKIFNDALCSEKE